MLPAFKFVKDLVGADRSLVLGAERLRWSTRGRDQRGFTLIELLVTLAILSILTAVAVPFVETTVRREKEIELRRDLRELRQALDNFHKDWKEGRISKSAAQVSEDGWPKNLQDLVDGVELNTAAGGQRARYLRRIPQDPFAGDKDTSEGGWGLRGYQDAAEAVRWGGKDVYDVYSLSLDKALDGTIYASW